MISAVCQANGGNPPPTLTLHKNDQPLGQPGQGEITHTFVVLAEDNTAVLVCEAMNRAMLEPQQNEMMLSVEYGPSTARITAPDYLLSGKESVLECKSGSSNPPTEIEWSVRSGREED